ncbi:MAG: hypothetical protein KBF47_17525 [Gemmatimonadales bacterium]|nr:hypothetical protein [Gemmatimonadales bacterium]
MSTITRIDYTVADGNVWTEEGDKYDMEASLDLLAEQIRDALRREYPEAVLMVTRENASGAVRAVRAESDDDDYGVGPASDDRLEQIAAVADAVWEAGDWYVKA